jgi:hypothetical protein
MLLPILNRGPVAAVRLNPDNPLNLQDIINKAIEKDCVYLVAKLGVSTAPEFQRIVDWRGVVINEPIGALAHLGLARAYVLQGDTAKARVAYQDFLTLWKDADADIPTLHAAKSENANLK